MSQEPPHQAARTILMVRPAAFGFNPQTAGTNRFQRAPNRQDRTGLERRALGEFDELVRRLTWAGVEVIVAADTPEPAKPDAVFPNNWVSFHPDGTVVFYPMYAPSRRLERRNDIVQSLAALRGFRVSRVLDLTPCASQGGFLEGTGSVVYDHVRRTAYASLSSRTDPELVRRLAAELGYEPVFFRASDPTGVPVYHTNVVLSLGTRFAVLATGAVTRVAEREDLVARLKESGRDLVAIDLEQMSAFAANVLELETGEGASILAMSARALRSLRADQVAILEGHASIVHAPLETIETVGGGSVRCMIAEVFLPRA